MFSHLKAFLFHNGSTSQTIAKNTFWLFFSQLASRLLRAIIVIYAARVLGASSWGAFSYALGITAFLTLFSDIGINALITRETSRHPTLQAQYVATALFIKLGLLAILTFIAVELAPYISKIPEALELLPILIFVFAFDTLRDLSSAICRALEKMQIEAALNALTNLAIVILGLIALYVQPTSYALALAYAGGSGLGMLAAFYKLRAHFSHLTRHFNASLIKPILLTAWPFGLMGMMGAIMINTDIIMLGWMRTAAEVGYYAVAQKIILIAYVIPGLLASSTFPALARFAQASPELARQILSKSLKIVMLAAVVLATLGLIASSWLIVYFFGAEYAPAITTFRLLLISLLLVFPGTLLGNALFAYNQQKIFLSFVAISTLLNATFNYIFISRWGIEGAALSTVATQLITNGLVYLKIKKVARL